MTEQPLSSQHNILKNLITTLNKQSNQDLIEQILVDTFKQAPDPIIPNITNYYTRLNSQLHRYVLKCYKHGEEDICLWRYIKNLSNEQLNYQDNCHPEIELLDYLMRVYFFSDPLDDLTCIFIPINNSNLIKNYLQWIKSYFYDANYPTSLLWLYALDSSLASLFPDEIIYLGKRLESDEVDIMLPDFGYPDAVLLKRFTHDPKHFIELSGEQANSEFQQIFSFLRREYKDRCLSRAGDQPQGLDRDVYQQEWETFEKVLRFGVSDKSENGCISFSDMRSSTSFLNVYGKIIYLNKIQQPFFERTQLISQKYGGRIDKFMGDNVMCVFLNNNMTGKTEADQELQAILNNFFALFQLCKMLHEIMIEHNFYTSSLGLRSGVTYGSQIIRSNLGNELVRDFTVTGESVNLAARLEHISIRELLLHNEVYFAKVIERFPRIRDLITVSDNYDNLNPQTKKIVQDFTVYQNIRSNLEKLDNVKFDIRLNHEFYSRLRQHLINKGYIIQNSESAEIYGYESFIVNGLPLNFYKSYYNPKGFSRYETIWIVPFDEIILENLDIETIL